MSIKVRVAERYFSSRIPLPGFLVQFLLNSYVNGRNLLDRATGRLTTIKLEPGGEIAEKSAELMRVHYDLPLRLFANILGGTMKYSTALWDRGVESLDEAQELMMRTVIRRARIEDGHSVLDLGCGFGSLCRQILKDLPGCRIHGLTMSKTQANYIRQMMKREGNPLNTQRFQLIEGDMNNVRIGRRFDRIVSLGVFEHVANLSKALEKMRNHMREGGYSFHHFIVYRSHLKENAPPRLDSFIGRYVFPGNRIWSYGEMEKHQGHFALEREWFLNGKNYKRTLQAWLRNFLNNRERIREETDLNERFMKLWEIYLRSCISTFRVGGGRYYGNGQYLLRPL